MSAEEDTLPAMDACFRVMLGVGCLRIMHHASCMRRRGICSGCLVGRYARDWNAGAVCYVGWSGL